MQAVITAYAVGKFVHILAVLVAFGPAFAYPAFGAVARRAAPRGVPAVLRGTIWADRFLATPGMVALLATGTYLLSEGRIASDQAWVMAGFLAVVALFAIVHAYLLPQRRRALEVAERDLAAGEALSPELEALCRRISLGGWLATLIVVVAVFFMVVKP